MHPGLTLMYLQDLPIGSRCIDMYTYFYWYMRDFGHAYVDVNAHFFPMLFKSFQNLFGSYDFILFKNFVIHLTFNLFVCLWKRQILYWLH